jgi:hypothetical protein
LLPADQDIDHLSDLGLATDDQVNFALPGALVLEQRDE